MNLPGNITRELSQISPGPFWLDNILGNQEKKNHSLGQELNHVAQGNFIREGKGRKEKEKGGEKGEKRKEGR